MKRRPIKSKKGKRPRTQVRHIEEARPLPFLACRGKIGFFRAEVEAT